MRIMFDADVLMDSIVDREPFTSESVAAIDLCLERGFACCIAAHTITNLYYILRKHKSPDERRDALLGLLSSFTVVGIDAAKLESALLNRDFADFEDCLQHECALAFSADYILTRNAKDYAGSRVPAIGPRELAGMARARAAGREA